MNTYLALLRGINVGGKNIIKMEALRACMEELGFAAVRTYIQSGNVIFRTDETDQAQLSAQIEDALAETFDYKLPVVLRSYAQMKGTVGQAPGGFGSEPDLYRYDVIFLKDPLTAEEAMPHVSAREGVDQAFSGDGVLYFSRLISRASGSRLSRIASTPIYPQLTIRNWNTTTRLLAMMDES